MPENNHRILLSEMTIGDVATLMVFNDGRMINNRLVSLGFTPGVIVKMLQNLGRGPLIVGVRGTRVALGRAEAAKIIVDQI